MRTWTEVTALGHITGLAQTPDGTILNVDIGQAAPLAVVIPADHGVPPLGARIQLTIHLAEDWPS